MAEKLDMSALADRIVDVRRPMIAIHTSPDGDAVGSAAALTIIFDRLGRSATCVCADPIPHRLAFITDYAPKGAFACGQAADTEGRELITVDLASPSQLGGLRDLFEGRTSFMIDHHAGAGHFAPVYVDPNAAAAGEIIYSLAQELVSRGALSEIDPPLASALYAAICSDSGCFKFANTKAESLRAAADLVELGADPAQIARGLFDTKSRRRLLAEGEVAGSIRCLGDGSISSVIITAARMAELGLEYADFDGCIDVIRTLEGTETAVFIREKADRSLKVSLRSVSRSALDVAAAFGGGGHVRAAACSFDSGTEPIKAETALVEEIMKQKCLRP